MNDHQQDFKRRAMESINALRQDTPIKELAMDLYQIYGLQSPLQSWISRMGACFNPAKPDLFHWCDIVLMMRLTGKYEPLHFVCDELGLSHPDPVDASAEIDKLQAEVRNLERALAARKERLELLGGNDSQMARFSRW